MNHEMASQQYDGHLVLTGETYVPTSCVLLLIALP
jgi:hypothetical protein